MFIHVFSSPVGPLLGGSSALPELGGNFSSLQAFQVKPMDQLWNLEYSLAGVHTHQALGWHTNHEGLHQEVEIHTPQICHPSSRENERHGSGTKYAFSMLLSNFAWKLLAATPPALLCWAYINPWRSREVIPTSMATNFRTPCSLELGADLCRKSGGYMNRKTAPIRMYDNAVTGIINAHNASHTASVVLKGGQRPVKAWSSPESWVWFTVHCNLVKRSKRGLRHFFVAQYTEQSIPTEWNTTRWQRTFGIIPGYIKEVLMVFLAIPPILTTWASPARAHRALRRPTQQSKAPWHRAEEGKSGHADFFFGKLSDWHKKKDLRHHGKFSSHLHVSREALPFLKLPVGPQKAGDFGRFDRNVQLVKVISLQHNIWFAGEQHRCQHKITQTQGETMFS